jgi:hypothetical protein
MSDHSRWRTYALIVVLLGIVALASVPSAWAAPRGYPLQQTVPPPTVVVPTMPVTATPVSQPTGAPVPIPTVDPGTGVPVLSVSVHVPIRNEGTAPWTGCSVLLEEVPGVDYLVEGELQAPPFSYPIATLAAGQETAFDFVAQLSSSAMPCFSYPLRVDLQCGAATTLLQEVLLSSPCDVLPNTGG